MKRSNSIFLLAVLGLLSLACGPSATTAHTPEATDSASIQISNPGPEEPVVIPVNQQIEQEGITVGVTEVTLTGKETTVNYWRDCGPYHLEPMDPAILLVGGEPVSGTGGGGGDPCDSSQVWQMIFPPLPAGVDRFSFRHGNIMGSSPEEIELELPLGDRLSELDPAFGGELELNLVAESGELAYRFTKLSMGIDRFTLDLQPANEATRDRPLGSPLGETFIEDDLENQYPGSRRSAGFQHPDPMTLVWEDERLEFGGHLDTQASTWRLRVPNLGKIYRGPWQFEIEIPTDAQVPSPSPTATQTPTLTPAPPVAVTPTATPAPGDPTRLMQALAMVPQEFSDQQVVFGDYAASRAALGVGPVQSAEDLIRDLGPDTQRLYEGVPMPPDLRVRAVNLRDHIGLDLFISDLGVWGFPNGPVKRPDVLLLQGPHPVGTISENLLALDYQTADHRNITYYWRGEDYAADLRHPLRPMTLLNRAALVENWFMSAPATGIMESLIDARAGQSPTLLDSPPHRVLAETMGHGLMGGAFLTPHRVLEIWNLGSSRPVNRLDRYTSGPDQWGRLSPYTVGLMGYRVQGESEEMVIALYYLSPQEAQDDAAELEKRWRTFHQDLTTSGPVEEPVARYCSPMSTRVVEEDDYSVLVGACKVVPEEGPGRSRKGAEMWSLLLDFGEVPFLAPDLEELRAAAEQRASE